MLLILPLRPGDSNEELRFALRSWEKNLLLPDGLELLTVGHCPPWLKPDYHMEGNFDKSATACVWGNILIGSVVAMDEPEALYMNDDFFCMDPVLQVPVFKRNKTLAEHVNMFPQYRTMWFPRSLALTASWLAGEGYPHPDSYEVHRPLLASPRGMIQAMRRWTGGLSGDIPQWRTAYGVLNEVEAVPVDDVKLGISASVAAGSPWVSTSDSSWRKFGRPIMQRFQKPSRWES